MGAEGQWKETCVKVDFLLMATGVDGIDKNGWAFLNENVPRIIATIVVEEEKQHATGFWNTISNNPSTPLPVMEMQAMRRIIWIACMQQGMGPPPESEEDEKGMDTDEKEQTLTGLPQMPPASDWAGGAGAAKPPYVAPEWTQVQERVGTEPEAVDTGQPSLGLPPNVNSILNDIQTVEQTGLEADLAGLAVGIASAAGITTSAAQLGGLADLSGLSAGLASVATAVSGKLPAATTVDLGFWGKLRDEAMGGKPTPTPTPKPVSTGLPVGSLAAVSSMPTYAEALASIGAEIGPTTRPVVTDAQREAELPGLILQAKTDGHTAYATMLEIELMKLRKDYKMVPLPASTEIELVDKPTVGAVTPTSLVVYQGQAKILQDQIQVATAAGNAHYAASLQADLDKLSTLMQELSFLSC